MLMSQAHAETLRGCVGLTCSGLFALNWPELLGYMTLGAMASQVARLFIQEATHGKVVYKAWPHFTFGALVALGVALLFHDSTPQRIVLASLMGGLCAYPILAITYKAIPDRYRRFLTRDDA